ncbi:transglutaminase-like domain-containing protein [Kurthia huakuii]|uniref:transglutaminase-like domain-containing protein n=1 Tax=Kurthia huakuii TaxID=1421019 RepID=UPI00049664B9|nr:transglutaminase-like domain-containing protein [Kurthia huakuii]MBM7698644.1 transglutaminase-like putative cysteine protease [Kurthia huakuii]
MPFQLESPFIDDYLKPTDVVNYQHPHIQQIIDTLHIAPLSELEKVQRLYEYVRDDIAHSWDEQNHVVTRTASEVAEHQTGICYAKANLLAALLRKEGIPSGFCYQRLMLFDEPEQGYYLHAFNGIYLTTLNRWIYVDARGNVQTELSIEEPALAFIPDESLGEKTYETIYVAPNNKTMHVLEEAQDALVMYTNDLPDTL